MQVKELTNTNLKRSYEVVVEADQIQKHMDDRLTEISKKVKIPGFRPGKVPLHVVKKQYGHSVLGEVLERVVNQSSQQLLRDKQLRPALRPEIEIKSFEEGGQLVFTTSLEIFPSLPEIKWESVSLEKWVVEADKDDLDKALERVSENHREFAPLKKERPAAKGDSLMIDFEGSVDGVIFNGGTATDFTIELGSGMLIPGFEDQLAGLKINDESVVKVKFPENYHEVSLRGKPAEFKVKVKAIMEPKPAELNDELAKKLGFESLEKLTEQLKQQVQKDLDNLAHSKLKRELFDAVDKQYHIDIPECMVKLEFDSLWSKIEERKNANPEYSNKTDEELKEEMQKMSDRRVRLGIILAETGKKENVQVTDEELRSAIISQAMQFPGQEKKVVEFYRSNPQAIEELRGPILEDKVVDFVLKKVAITEKPISSKKLLEYYENQE